MGNTEKTGKIRNFREQKSYKFGKNPEKPESKHILEIRLKR